MANKKKNRESRLKNSQNKNVITKVEINKPLENIKGSNKTEIKNEKMTNVLKNNKQENSKDKSLKSNNDSEKTLKFKIIDILENKHVPVISRFYKIFWILKNDPKDKKKMWYHVLILLGGFFVIAIALLIAGLSLSGIINVSFGGSGNDIFTGVAFAIAVIVGIVI